MIPKYQWIDMFRKLITGILAIATIAPGNVYAASDEDTKKAIESFYGEYGFMNKIWACEGLSRAFNEVQGRRSPNRKYRYSVSDYMSDAFYKEYEYYMVTSSSKFRELAHDPLTSRIIKTFFRDLNADKFVEKEYRIPINYCTRSAIVFIQFSATNREKRPLSDWGKKVVRDNWEKFLLENPAPKIAPL